MYVCICKAVTEKHIQKAVAEGASHFRALREKTGVATQCGKCCGDAKQCFQKLAIAPLPVSVVDAVATAC